MSANQQMIPVIGEHYRQFLVLSSQGDNPTTGPLQYPVAHHGQESQRNCV
jgi:hypothetical protein